MKKILLICTILIGLVSSCKYFMEDHLIKNKDQRLEVSLKFNERIKLIMDHDPNINAIISQELTPWEREGFEFLYGYMPLSDLAMHPGDYVLNQVKNAYEAKQNFKWGKKIPSDVFLHFVLPYRVNNEYTDTARQVFFAELKDRIKGMNMYDAALEVNHWCHEKVTYKSTDERTSGPLTTVRTAFGRCGEESTFVVAALRSVSIPARQVYTPRWAHTDDNHAWVEVWINGKWYFLGACEPEPELNMGWFAGPAKRAMMTRTFVFGKYDGDDEKLTQSDYYTEINLLQNYAPTKQLKVKVINESGEPQANAFVEFQLYNYAEFYPIAKCETNNEGACSLTTGFGDLMIWASKDGKHGFSKAEGTSSDEVVVTISSSQIFADYNITLVPPKEQPVASADQAKIDANNLRLKQEDQIRNNYIATFIDSVSVANLALSKGASICETWRLVSLSRGNWAEIYNFIKNLDSNDVGLGMALLKSISEKDLHDITSATLQDHLANTYKFPPLVDAKKVEIFDKHILSPRIGREFVTPWRSFLQNSLTYDEIGFIRNNPYNLAQWIIDSIKIDKETNYYRVPLSPESVYKFRIADEYSRNIFFVAACRSCGVPARLEPSTKRPQFMKNEEWHDVLFDETPEKTIPKGSLNLTLAKNQPVENPQYYSHFTIGKLEEGKFISLDFENDKNMNNLPATLTLDAGYYRLVTGNRQSNGTVLCKLKYFEIKTDQSTSITIEFNSDTKTNELIGKIELSTNIPNIEGMHSNILSDFVKDKGVVLAIIDPIKEPTKHLMNDIAAVKNELNGWGGSILFIVGSDKMVEGFSESSFSNLPEKKYFGYDVDQQLSKVIAEACGKQPSINYPIVLVISQKGEVTFYSEGYSIGLGQQILNYIN